MNVIVGLGNPGLPYAATRHNIGFEVIERLAHQYQIEVNKKKFRGLVGQGMINGQKVLLVKPLTYMNSSGECVRSVLDFYQLSPDNLMVIYDDISLEIGRLRLREKGSAGGHNGIKNIIAHVGSSFARVKFGVGPQTPGMDSADYVMQRFPKEALPTVFEMMEQTVGCIEVWLEKGCASAMNQFNN